MKLLNTTACALCAATMVLTPAGATQDTSPLTFEEDGKQVFMPGYFERFSPQTALDMVNNLPGFQIDRADNKRGLGQGGTNVLINGSRVSGKSTDPLDVLGRTSHEAVVRIEIVDGASLGISGLSGPVADVTLNTTERTGNWEWNGQFRKGLPSRYTNGSVSVSGSIKDVSYTLSLENDSFRSGGWGEEFVTDGQGDLIETRYLKSKNIGENPNVSLVLGHEDDKGREANFNGSFAIFDFERAFERDGTSADPARPDRLGIFPGGEDEWNTEISGDYAFGAFGGRMKLIAFQYLEDSEFTNSSQIFDDGAFVGAGRFDRRIYEGETILRAEQTWPMGDERSFELGVEGVYNFNDTESSRFDVDETGNETLVEFSGGNTKVEEIRYDLSASYNFPIGEKLDIQASLAAEYSEIEQTGDTGIFAKAADDSFILDDNGQRIELPKTRNFTRPKGFLSATYEWSDSVELRARFEREVGQLNFFAFASSVSLQNDNDRAGNTDLVPQQSWVYEIALEKTFKDESQITFAFEYEDIEDRVEQVPIILVDPDTGDETLTDGLGNVPEATRWRFNVSGTQMLDRFGIKGGQLDYEFQYRDSEIDDPFTSVARRLNGESKWFYNFDFRHDIPNTDFAWGVLVEDFRNAEQFFGDEITLYSQSEPVTEIFVEHKDFYGMNAQLYVFNVLDFTEDFRRDRFTAFRPDGVLDRREQQVFDFDPIIGINLSKTF